MVPSIEAKKTLANKKPTYKQKSAVVCNVFFIFPATVKIYLFLGLKQVLTEVFFGYQTLVLGLY